MKTQTTKPRDNIFDDVVIKKAADESCAENKRRQSIEVDTAAQDEEKRRSSQPQVVAEVNGTSRCFALEQAYVHDVYAQIARECGACSPVRSHIKEFLFEELEFGSILIDIGCGDGKYLNLNSGLFSFGLEKCGDWFSGDTNHEARTPNSRQIRGDFLLGDVLNVPIRDEFFDAALCCGVLHHIATFERRIVALREIARVLKIGGKILITVWAFEGREVRAHR